MLATGASSALLLLLLIVATEATILNITNRCSYTVWPATLPVGGGARSLESGQVWTLDVPAGITGCLWARTGCWFSSNGKGSCKTGDCGGDFACNISGKPPYTVVEIKTSSPQNLFDISLVDGFNVPMEILPVPVQGEKECSKGLRCAANITSQCPEEMKVPGGCNNTCTTGTGSSNCTYSGFFKRMCPDAYSRLSDDSATHSCPAGTKYQVIFCPPMNLTISPAAARAGQRTRVRPTIVAIAIGASVGSVILVAVLFTITSYIRTRRAQWKHQLTEEEHEFGGELQGTPMRFTFQQLKVATEQFTDKLGKEDLGLFSRDNLGRAVLQ
jgi:hypothetical protein